MSGKSVHLCEKCHIFAQFLIKRFCEAQRHDRPHVIWRFCVPWSLRTIQSAHILKKTILTQCRKTCKNFLVCKYSGPNPTHSSGCTLRLAAARLRPLFGTLPEFREEWQFCFNVTYSCYYLFISFFCIVIGSATRLAQHHTLFQAGALSMCFGEQPGFFS